MQKKSVSGYLDAGSIDLFAQQIREVIKTVRAIAIYDADGEMAWNDSHRDDNPLWIDDDFQRAKVPGQGYCEKLDNGNFVYVFYLCHDEDDEPTATLNVQVASSDPVSFEFALNEVKPFLECIERQITINRDLSAMRRLSAEGRQALKLLQRIDEIDTSLDLAVVLSNILEMAAEHYKVPLAAIALPQAGLLQAHPASHLDEPDAATFIQSTLARLVTHAQADHRIQVFDSMIKAGSGSLVRLFNSKIMSSPITNSKDQVVGVFALFGERKFTPEQMRLCRALSAKINGIARSAQQVPGARFSRHGFLSHVANVLRQDRHQSHAMLFMDIDKLHIVNDRYGHMAGDQVIQTVKEILDDACGSTDAVAHLSGDNFAVFLKNAEQQQAVEKGEMILDTLTRTEVVHDNESIAVSASIGIAMYPDVVSDAAAGLNTAELAARSARDRGGNRIVVFQDLDASVAQRRSDLDHVNKLQHALIDNRFVLYGQPIVPLCAEDTRSHFEILIRMIGEGDELDPPGKFLSAAERYQMMSAIDRWVIRNTLEQLANSDNSLEINLSSFNINLSAQSLVAEDFIEFVETRIAEFGISPDLLCFEITETAVVRNLERAQRCIRMLRKLGCRVALDDFGTGYCSFAYLKDLPVHYIKVDGAFVRDLLVNPLSESIVAAMTGIAGVMDAATIAEHVETEVVLKRLEQMGVDYVQGFMFGKPQSLEDVLSGMGQESKSADPGVTGTLALS